MSTAVLMDGAALERALTRMAHEIVEHNPEPESLVFIGIHTHGTPLAQRLAAKVGTILKREFPVGELDISMHRDDLALRDVAAAGGTLQYYFRCHQPGGCAGG